jgi:hypothetical protein
VNGLEISFRATISRRRSGALLQLSTSLSGSNTPIHEVCCSAAGSARRQSSDEDVGRTGRWFQADGGVEAGRIEWRGVVDTHPEAWSRALQRWGGKLAKSGLESGSMTPWLVRELAKVGFSVKSDKADALPEMLRTGWYRAVYVKSQDSHRLKAMVGARDQLVRAKRALGNQVRGLLRPFGIRQPWWQVCRAGASGGAARITCSTRA